MITSIHNARLKRMRGLAARAKERREAMAFLAEGVRLIEDAHGTGWPFHQVVYTGSLSARGLELVTRLRQSGVECDLLSDAVMNSLSETATSQGILAELAFQELPLPQLLTFTLIADQVRDPGNLGSLLRAAAAAGAQAAFLPPETTDAFSPKAIRSGMGAQFRLPIRALSWEEIESLCAQSRLRLMLATMDGAPYWEQNFRDPLALIIGGEAEGAGSRARALAHPVGIPMPGGVESLNAGVAGGILLFETVRQRSHGVSYRVDGEKINP